MAMRKIGEATTNSQGVASYSYTGVGAGLLNLRAKLKDSTLQTETYTIFDCIKYDPLTSDNSIFSGSNATRTFSSDGLTSVQDGTGASTLTYYPNGTLHSLSGSNAIEFDLYTVNNIAIALFDNGGNPRQVYTFENYTGAWHNVRIEFNSSTSKAKIYIDNEYKTEVDLSIYTMTTYGFRFVDWQADMDMKIKELKIYPI